MVLIVISSSQVLSKQNNFRKGDDMGKRGFFAGVTTILVGGLLLAAGTASGQDTSIEAVQKNFARNYKKALRGEIKLTTNLPVGKPMIVYVPDPTDATFHIKKVGAVLPLTDADAQACGVRCKFEVIAAPK